MFRSRAMLGVLWVLLTFYVGSYAVLSRRGMEEAERCNMQGFYYFFPDPEGKGAWRAKHFTCCWLYSPINAIDQAIGLGKCPAREPFWGLSKE
jgi:hypothetical protein